MNRRSTLEYLRLGMLSLLPVLAAGAFTLSVLTEGVPFWTHIFRILMSGVVGFYTNWVAIKMLFHPKEPLPLSHWQGLVPKNRGKLATEVGRKVSEVLLSPEIITRAVIRMNLIGQLGQWASKEALGWLELPGNRKLVEKRVGKAIQEFSTDGIEPALDGLIALLDRTVRDEKTLLRLLDSLRNLLGWLISNEKCRELFGHLVSSVASASLDEKGVAARLIEKLLDDLQDRMKDEAWRRGAADRCVALVQNLSRDNLGAAFDLGLKQFEAILSDETKTGRLVEALAKILGAMASSEAVIDFLAEQFTELLKKNSATLGTMINDAIMQHGKWYQQLAKMIILPERDIVKLLGKLASDPSTRTRIREFLLEKLDLVQALRNKATQRKLIRLIQSHRTPIIEGCATGGREILAGMIEGLLGSKGFWDFVRTRIEAAGPWLERKARSLIPTVIGYLREYVRKSGIGPAIQGWLLEKEKTLAPKLASPESARKLSAFIADNRDTLDDLLEHRLRPWLVKASSRLLSSDGFWSWVEEHVALWVPRLAARAETFLAQEKVMDFVHGLIPGLASKMHLDRIVEEQVAEFSTDDLEAMVNDVSGENLAGIEVFGGILGLAAGTLTVITECWYYAAATLGIFVVWGAAEVAASLVRGRKGSSVPPSPS